MSGSPVSLIQDVLGVSGGEGVLINAILLLPKNTTSKQIKE